VKTVSIYSLRIKCAAASRFLHPHRGDLELRDFGHWIQGRVGEEVGCGFGKVEGGEDNAWLHPVGDLSSGNNLTAAGYNLDQIAIFDAQLARILPWD